jgi:hypothetical protein
MRKQKKKDGLRQYVVEGTQMVLVRRVVWAESPYKARRAVKESMYNAHDRGKSLDHMITGDFWGYKVIRVQEA